MEYVTAASELYLEYPWLSYGVGATHIPILVAFATAAVLEMVIKMPFCEKYMIRYKGTKRRADEVKVSQAKIPFRQQVLRTLRVFFGPMSFISSLVIRYLTLPAEGKWTGPVLPDPIEFVIHFVIAAFVADFGLYWGHRLQHDIKFLWEKCHWEHHQVQNPTPFTIAFIDENDATLQAGIPVILTTLLLSLGLNAHPITLLAYTTFHFCNNVINHSGIDAWWLNLITGKFLPLRCRNTFHDYHHHFSNRSSNTKNFAEMFWIYDWIFGTYCDVSVLTVHDK